MKKILLLLILFFGSISSLSAETSRIVSGNKNSFQEAYQDARNHILSGKAFNHLKKIQTQKASLEMILLISNCHLQNKDCCNTKK